jgi:uncharacterized protein
MNRTIPLPPPETGARARVEWSPSDVNRFLECPHLARLERARESGSERASDPHAEMLAAKGLEHERAWLARFANEGRRIVEIDARHGEWDRTAALTARAMSDGADVIYQGVFADGDWCGMADFLVRVDTPSSLGAWSYEAWDAKLARRTRPYFVLQLCFYSEQLARLQAVAPEDMVVVTGGGELVRLKYRDFDAYYRAVRRRFVEAMRADRPTYPYPVPHCELCEHRQRCDNQWLVDDHLSRVAGIRREQVMRLNDAGIGTVAELAAMDPTRRIGIGAAALERLRHQAALQDEHRRSGRHRVEVLRIDERSGFRLLPKPSAGDVFFDIEADPYFEPARGLEYLFGVLTPNSHLGPPDAAYSFLPLLALTREDEKRVFERFVDFVHERLREYPDLHVYHYAPYEPSALKRLMSVYGTREAELDDLLRREVFVDLYQVVRQSIRISHDSYSLKKVRTFFMKDSGQSGVADGGDSILQFERWRHTGDSTLLDAIVRYNEEDCLSTMKLRDWLFDCKAEAEGRDGVLAAWKRPGELKESPEREEEDDHTQRRRERLLELARMPDGGTAAAQPTLFDIRPESSGMQGAALVLLADLLSYHRREAKPAWWAYFDRQTQSIEDLIDGSEAIAGLKPASDEPPRHDTRSMVYPLDFPPQEHKLAAGDKVEDPFRGSSAGTMVRIDNERGRLWLKRSTTRRDEPLPAAVSVPKPIDTRQQRAAIGRIADAVTSTEVDADRYAAALDILARALPRLRGMPRGARLNTLDHDRQKAVVASLDRSCLFIQGPPGSGKTHTAARLIVSLIAEGKRVGAAANSHKAINNLLAEVEAVALAAGIRFKGLKKNSNEDDVFDGCLIENTTENADCASKSVALVAGTSWLFSRQEMDQGLDHLFVDEAGQVALADTVAMATSAANVVLLGDPQQLPQIRQGVHPPIDVGLVSSDVRGVTVTAGCSVLEHLLGGASTVPDDRGIFLARTWRMHPDVCSFISALSYEGRLESAEGLDRQRVDSPGLSGAGLRHLAVEHDGNSQQSYEEARVIAREVKKLLDGGTFTDSACRTRPLTPADILVVAPYNMQVRCLREKLPAGVEAGTVDRFQGREAPIVFFSMASSSGEDVPRGLEFLFSRNRFNVAISRARAMAVVVNSPRLLETRCRRVEQMQLVNSLCRFVETTGSRT